MPATVDTTRFGWSDGIDAAGDAAGDAGAAGADWPAEVELVLSALEAAGADHDDRRQNPRLRHRALADLRLFSDKPGAAPWRLYTRDVSIRGIGFVTRERLPLGYGGVITLAAPDGRHATVNGTLFRCRDIGNGWFEGALYFNRDQFQFAPANAD